MTTVSDSNLPPEQWRPLFDRADIEFGYRPLTTRAGLTHTRVHRLLRGGGTTNEAITRVAEAFGVKPAKVRELRGEAAVEVEPFTLPDDAGRLNDTERNVIRSMIRALLDAREQPHADQSAEPDPATQAPRASREANEDEKTKPSGLNPADQAADIEDRQSDYEAVARTRRPGIPPEDDGGTGVGEAPDPEGPEGGA